MRILRVHEDPASTNPLFSFSTLLQLQRSQVYSFFVARYFKLHTGSDLAPWPQNSLPRPWAWPPQAPQHAHAFCTLARTHVHTHTARADVVYGLRKRCTRAHYQCTHTTRVYKRVRARYIRYITTTRREPQADTALGLPGERPAQHAPRRICVCDSCVSRTRAIGRWR